MKGPFELRDYGYEVFDSEGKIVCEAGGWSDDDDNARREKAERIRDALNVMHYMSQWAKENK